MGIYPLVPDLVRKTRGENALSVPQFVFYLGRESGGAELFGGAEYEAPAVREGPLRSISSRMRTERRRRSLYRRLPGRRPSSPEYVALLSVEAPRNAPISFLNSASYLLSAMYTLSTFILPSVSVPVLSRQITSTWARFSREYRSWTSTSRFDRRIIPVARPMPIMRTRPLGSMPKSPAEVETTPRRGRRRLLKSRPAKTG